MRVYYIVYVISTYMYIMNYAVIAFLSLKTLFSELLLLPYVILIMSTYAAEEDLLFRIEKTIALTCVRVCFARIIFFLILTKIRSTRVSYNIVL